MSAMEWYRPQNLQQALEILEKQRPVVVCGGTDLFINWPRRRSQFEGRDWLSIEGIETLRRIEMENGDLVIGASVTAEEIWSSALCEQVPALGQAARVVGGWQIQNRATLGGNLANASPAADMVVPLVAYGASVVLQSTGGTRMVPVAEFLLGPRKTALQANEMITAIRIPKHVLGVPQRFIRLDQRGGTDISLVSAAAVVSRDAERVTFARVAVGAANPVPFSLPEVDNRLVGRIDEQIIADVAREYGKRATPITDIRASAEYRSSMAEVLVKKALLELIEDNNVKGTR